MRLLTFVLFLLFCTAAKADENKLNLTFYGSFVHSSQVPNSLFFFSAIEKNDSFELRRALRNERIDTIVLASDGGSVWEALSMAGVIFDKRMNTYVPDLPNRKGCYSACSYMFFAGRNRIAKGELGVHQIGAYDKDTDTQKLELGLAQQSTQFTTSEVIGFLNEFQTPPWVFERMFRSREMYQFSEDEKDELSSGELSEEVQNDINVFLTALLTELDEKNEHQPRAPTLEYLNVKDSEMVKSFQAALNNAKCSAGRVDGVWGRRTSSAASRFAKANQLSYSGVQSIDAEFINELSADDKRPCPPPPKPKKTMAGVWAIKLRCEGEASWATATIRPLGNRFHIDVLSGEGGSSGAVYPQGRTFGIILTQNVGRGVVRGSGEVLASMNQMTGKISNCSFTGQRKR